MRSASSAPQVVAEITNAAAELVGSPTTKAWATTANGATHRGSSRFAFDWLDEQLR